MLKRISRVSEAPLRLTLLVKTFSSRSPVAAPAVRSRTHVSAFALVVLLTRSRRNINSNCQVLGLHRVEVQRPISLSPSLKYYKKIIKKLYRN